jgi:hypothetical protein
MADHEAPAGRQSAAPRPSRLDARGIDLRTPAEGEAHVWRVPLPALAGRPAARRALREILGAYLGIAPEAVELRAAEQGKPQFPDPAPLSFNLSHTGRLALVAVAAAATPVGVDVERMKPRRDPLRLARRRLPPEDAPAIEAAPEGPQRQAAFHAAWVAYEARVKCTGVGLDGPPPPATVVAHPLEVGDGYAAAVAVDQGAGGPERVSGPAAVTPESAPGSAAGPIPPAPPRITLRDWDGPPTA